MPRLVLVGLAAACLLAPLDGFPGLLGLAALGALGSAFALQGLALTHHRSSSLRTRLPLLVGLYVMVALSQGAILIPIAIVGLADVAFGLRGRDPVARTGPPHPPSQT